MHSVRVTRYRVKHDQAKQFETHAIAQAQRMHESGPGVIAYAFVRRAGELPRGPSLFSNPLSGTVEYIQIAVAVDAGGDAQISTGEATEWRQAMQNTLLMPPEIENIEPPSFVAGVSRDHVWGPDSIFRCAIFRMRAKPNEEPLETGALRMMRSVVDREPDPPLYTITKRNPGGSTLLPGALDGYAEYLRFHVYRHDSGLSHHADLDKEWWGAYYPQYLIAPLESMAVAGSEVVAGFTRDHVWGAADTYEAP